MSSLSSENIRVVDALRFCRIARSARGREPCQEPASSRRWQNSRRDLPRRGDRYDSMTLPALRAQRPAAAGRLARPLAQLRPRPAHWTPSGRSCGGRSTSASPTSTWPTTTVRRTARPRRTSAGSSRDDLRPYRDELVISTKAGYDMWPGPYGDWGSRKYLLASLDQSLRRMGLDYVDIFYSPPLRPGHPARGDDGRAGHGGAVRPGAVRRHLVLLRRSAPQRRPRSCASWARRC